MNTVQGCWDAYWKTLMKHGVAGNDEALARSIFYAGAISHWQIRFLILAGPYSEAARDVLLRSLDDEMLSAAKGVIVNTVGAPGHA